MAPNYHVQRRLIEKVRRHLPQDFLPIQQIKQRNQLENWNLSILSNSETLNNEYIERTHQMSYSSLSELECCRYLVNSFLLKRLYETL